MSGPGGLKLTAKEFVPSGAGKRAPPSYPVVDRLEGPSMLLLCDVTV